MGEAKRNRETPRPPELVIVKVQVALATNSPTPPPALVYDEQRRHVVESHDPALARAMAERPAPRCHKDFFWATWTGDTWLVDIARGSAPWQDW